jgi:hypothetical protein
MAESEKKEMEHIINELRNQMSSLLSENSKLQKKYERSKSKKGRNYAGQTNSSVYK